MVAVDVAVVVVGADNDNGMMTTIMMMMIMTTTTTTKMHIYVLGVCYCWALSICLCVVSNVKVNTMSCLQPLVFMAYVWMSGRDRIFDRQLLSQRCRTMFWVHSFLRYTLYSAWTFSN